MSKCITALLALIALSADADNIKGAWSEVGRWPIIAIHAALLPDGRVITYGSDPDKGRTAAFVYSIWDPEEGLSESGPPKLPNTTGTDLFCSAQILLPDSGELLIAGGDTYVAGSDGITDDDNNHPTNATTIFIPAKTDQPDRIVQGQHYMHLPRWYATTTMLPNGEIFIQGGKRTPKPSNTRTEYPEVRKRNGEFIRKEGIDTSSYHYWYPRNFVAPDGRIFGFTTVDDPGPKSKMYYMGIDDDGDLEHLGQLAVEPDSGGSSNLSFEFSSSVMYKPGKILHVSGQSAGDSSDSGHAVIIDITRQAPQITPTNPLSDKRKWLNLTLLPDGKVVATGGSTKNSNDNTSGTIEQNIGLIHNSVEIWNPETEEWSVGAEEAKPRLYHSVAILLPDATVLTAGGGLNTKPVPPQLNGQVYKPPYLFDQDGNLATRPIITSAPKSVAYGEEVTIGVNDGSDISSVSLVKLGSVTHSFNFEQRIVTLDFTATENVLRFVSPTDPNHATPGFYMIFIFNNAGVPSVASITQLRVLAGGGG